MNDIQKKFNIGGEFKDKKLEKEYLKVAWDHHGKLYLSMYPICAILLLMAGLVVDYKRAFYWGSADILTNLRVVLLVGCSYFAIHFWRKNDYPKRFDIYGTLLSIYSAIIITVLNSMTAGLSKTMLPGMIILTTSFYVLLANRLIYSVVPSLVLLITFVFFFDSTKLDIGRHEYMIFLLIAMNTVFFLFKHSWNKSSRTSFLVSKFHQEVSLAKNNVLKIIGHDLKNPFTIIHGHTFFAKRKLEKGDQEAVYNCLDGIEKSVMKADTLLQNLMSWAITEAEAPAKDDKDIKQSIENAISFGSSIAHQKNIEIVTSIESLEVEHNANIIETVIRNILVNAVKFSPKESTINISSVRESSHYMIHVSDQGIGMPEALINQIVKGRNSSTSEGTDGEAGNGVGLKLVHDLIIRHDGELDIQSQENEGTTFMIKLAA